MQVCYDFYMDMYVLAFSAFSGIGTRRFEQLIARFGSAENAWKASENNIIAVLKPVLGQKFCEFRKTFSPEKYAEEIAKRDIQWLTPADTAYSVLLKKLDHPPFILFAKGAIALLQNEKAIGVVGTRKVTDYGKQVTEMFVRDLVAHDFTIVSGMALGVDGIAHKQTCKNNGKTIAVLGSGVDVPTPREQYGLYTEILENKGLIVSTFSPGKDASTGSFPARNAIIAGLSLGILVTEGAETSGSLITASFAKKFGRFLFAVPGQITSNLSKGTNSLIKNGAVPVSSATDILDTLGIMETQKKLVSSANHIGLSPIERQILALLENGPLHFDEIVRYSGKDSKNVGSFLSLMELKGIIRSNSEGKYFL